MAVGFAAAAAAGDADALRHLDQLLAATQPVAFLGDWRQHAAVARLRDAAQLRLIALGRLAAAQRDAWCAERCDALALAARGLRGERVALLTDLALMAEDLDQWESRLRGGFGSLVDGGRHYLLFPHILAGWAQRDRELAALLDGRPPASPSAAWTHGTSFESAVDWSRELQRHRTIRAAAQVVVAWRAGGAAGHAVPADQEQARTVIAAALLAGDRFLPPLVYERLSPTRFRLGVDPAGALPAFSTAAQLSVQTTVGTPAATEPLVDLPWSVELDCAALPTDPAPAP